jgi:chromosome segregation ATPase
MEGRRQTSSTGGRGRRPDVGAGAAHRTNEQLVTVYERNRELERERTGAHQLVLVLVRLVGHLQDQVDELGHRPDAAAELDAVHEQLRVAKQELERARRAREEAELLADRTQQRATALEEELARARQVMPQNDVSVAVDFATAQLPPELQEESILADVDRALRTAEGCLQEGAERVEGEASTSSAGGRSLGTSHSASACVPGQAPQGRSVEAGNGYITGT